MLISRGYPEVAGRGLSGPTLHRQPQLKQRRMGTALQVSRFSGKANVDERKTVTMYPTI